MTTTNRLAAGALCAALLGCQATSEPMDEVLPGLRMDSAEQIQREEEHLEFLRGQLPFHVLWSTSALGGETIRSVTLTDRELLVVNGAWRLYSVDRKSGLVNWVYQLRHPLATQGAERRLVEPAVSDQFVYVLYHGDTLGAIWRSSGKPRWLRKIVEFTPGSNLAGNDYYVFLGALDRNRLVAIRESDQGVAWDYTTHDSVIARPAHSDPTVYFADLGGTVYGVNVANGRTSWTYNAGRGVTADAYVHGGKVYIGSQDHALYALDRYSGRPKWVFEAGGPVLDRATVGGDTCYVRITDPPDRFGIPGEPTLVAIQDESGQELWRLRRGARLVFRGEKNAYILREGGVLVPVEDATGRVRMPAPDQDGWALAEQFPFIPTNDVDDVCYLATADGFIFALKETNPRPYQ